MYAKKYWMRPYDIKTQSECPVLQTTGRSAKNYPAAASA